MKHILVVVMLLAGCRFAPASSTKADETADMKPTDTLDARPVDGITATKQRSECGDGECSAAENACTCEKDCKISVCSAEGGTFHQTYFECVDGAPRRRDEAATACAVDGRSCSTADAVCYVVGKEFHKVAASGDETHCVDGVCKPPEATRPTRSKASDAVPDSAGGQPSETPDPAQNTTNPVPPSGAAPGGNP